MSSPQKAHSVSSHLQLDLADYDRSIRQLVPHYDEMMTSALSLLTALVSPSARIMDLGSGTGRASEAILRGLPNATALLVDVDAEILDAARKRLRPFGNRASFRLGSFLDPLPGADAVLASLSLHHVPDLATKTEVFRRIGAALSPGGLFLCCDAVVSRDPVLAALTMRGWAQSMAAHGIDEATARGHFAAWSAEDHYMPLASELEAMQAAGFPEPECFWRLGPVAIYGGRATQSSQGPA